MTTEQNKFIQWLGFAIAGLLLIAVGLGIVGVIIHIGEWAFNAD